MEKGIRILVVDDEESLREALRTYLELEGYRVDSAASAEDALAMHPEDHDLLILDIMMDGMSGMELATHLREKGSIIPIIFLTAKDTDEDMVAGLRNGADDYISKPCSMRNLLARIEAVLRRCGSVRRNHCGVVCDRRSMICTVDGSPVQLPRKEFEILALLTENPGRIFTREELLDRIWPERVIVADRSVDVHVTRLRGKIAPYGRNIITRSGYGYGWQD